MENVESCSKNNAVKSVNFVLIFKSSIENFEKIIEIINKDDFFKKEFDNTSIENATSFTAMSNNVKIDKIKKVNVICTKKENNGNVVTFGMDKNVLLISYNYYTKWSKISEKTYKYIEKAMNLVTEEYEINKIILDYFNEFKINKTSGWKERLFKKDNKYLTKNILSSDDFWHVNQGYFSKLSNYKELDNININYFANQNGNSQHKVNLKFQHTLFYNEVFDLKKIKDFFSVMHSHSKKIFADIIHENIIFDFKKKSSYE